ncbi:MAG TPA: POTRA domain-containing protein, partial [Pyrinomonadaceae bacterium]|nr:POTRA domain-containing protein [Pyrinomonadaceae bacterium]
MILIRPRQRSSRPLAARRPLAAAFALSLAFACGVLAQTPLPPPPQPPQSSRSSPPPSRPAQPSQDAQAMLLTQIEFEGLKRVSREDALAASGLQLGQPVGVNDLDAAANKLMGSGLFKNLAYSVRGTSEKAAVTFKVEEMTSSVPVVFDNFVWFTDEEVTEAVRRKLPSFDGTAPEAGNVTETIRAALQELLRARQITGAVEYTLSAEQRGPGSEHLFTVKGPSLRVCKLEFPGARALQPELLVQKSGGIFDNDYSRKYVGSFAENTLLPLYHERGYLRAGFLAPRVRAEEASENCDGGGVAVTLPVEEGAVYLWERAEWEGNEGLTAEELSAALGMRSNEIANALKVDKGVGSVRKAYGRKGYLAALAEATPVFDDAARRVTFRFKITEGPQYRMGALNIEGLSEQDTNNLRVRWSLLPREIYDEGYLGEFLKKSVAELVKDAARQGRPLKPFKVESAVRPDREKLTVDVTITFKPDTGPPPPESPR